MHLDTIGGLIGMGTKHRILFAVPGLAGHVGPSLAIAKQLIIEGHHIGYVSGEPVRAMIEKAGVHEFYARPRYQHMILDKDTLVRGWLEYWSKVPSVYTVEAIRACFHELIQAVESFKPDIMYVDTYDFLAAAVADKYHLPYAHGSAAPIAYIEKNIPLLGTGWDIRTPRWNMVKLIPLLLAAAPYMLRGFLHQRKAIKTIDPNWKTTNYYGVSPYLYLFYSTDKVEYSRKLFIPTIFYVGPSILEPDHLPDFPWEKLDESKPLIYIATGTMFSEHYQEFYAHALSALSAKNFPLPVQVVMAIGKGQSMELFGKIPDNFIVVPFAPQIKLLERAKVVITHGGVNSINETFMFGKPMLIVHWGGDRMEFAQRVAHQGAGISLDVDKATPRRIRKAVLELLTQPRYARASEGVMKSYRSCGGAKTAAGLLIRLAETRQPILRKPGAPVTLCDIRDLPDYLQ
jgi:zeaxanthin glucosyltransferase